MKKLDARDEYKILSNESAKQTTSACFNLSKTVETCLYISADCKSIYVIP